MIKGVFLRAHVQAVHKHQGSAGVDELERRYGQPLRFRTLQKVPIADELRLLDHAYDISFDRDPAASLWPDRESALGHFHFQNFLLTPFARTFFAWFRHSTPTIMLKAGEVAKHIFYHVEFYSQPTGPNQVVIHTKNFPYSGDHFCSFLKACLQFTGYLGRVQCQADDHLATKFAVEWEPKEIREV